VGRQFLDRTYTRRPVTSKLELSRKLAGRDPEEMDARSTGDRRTSRFAGLGLVVVLLVVNSCGSDEKLTADSSERAAATPTTVPTLDDSPEEVTPTSVQAQPEPDPDNSDNEGAGEEGPSGFDWPSQWADPTGGIAQRWRDWGFNTCGPDDAGADYEFNDSSWYLPGSAHLGVDSKGAPAGTPITVVARGVIASAGQPWGQEWGTVAVVEHLTETGERFAAVYGHLEPGSVTAEGTIRVDEQLGVVKAGQPLGDHLHFAIVPLVGDESAADITLLGATTCEPLEEGPSYGFVHPIRFLEGADPSG